MSTAAQINKHVTIKMNQVKVKIFMLSIAKHAHVYKYVEFLTSKRWFE